MSTISTKEIVDAFTAKVQERLDADRLDAPVRLDNTHTVVIIALKGKGPIHATIQGGITDEGVANVLKQLQTVPSLKDLVLPG
jgi:hypothetical protein